MFLICITLKCLLSVLKGFILPVIANSTHNNSGLDVKHCGSAGRICDPFRRVCRSACTYETRRHLSICSSVRKGSPSYTLRITVDRAPVRIGIRGGIVAIEHARAGIVAIVSVAQTNSTTNRVAEGSTYFLIKSDAKIHTFIVIQQVKERYLTLFVREGLARRRGRPPDGGGVLCTLRVPTYHAPTVSFVLNGAANSQRTAPPFAPAPEGALLPLSKHEPA